MRPEDFETFSTLVKQRSGLVLTREKAYLLESRLLPVVRRGGMTTLEDLAHALRSKRDEKLMAAIVEAMTTNESSFFRDRKPFEFFQKVLLPSLIAHRSAKRHLRLWSAGTSSGQEAYSLAMICCEEAEKLQGFTIDILGTDLSGEMIERAKSGIYSQFEVQRGLPITRLVKYFSQLSRDKWQINEKIRGMVRFNEGNLLRDFGPVGVFDVIFCRNVLHYFDIPTQVHVIDAFSQVLASDGSLVLGTTETVPIANDRFKPAGSDQTSRYVLSG